MNTFFTILVLLTILFAIFIGFISYLKDPEKYTGIAESNKNAAREMKREAKKSVTTSFSKGKESQTYFKNFNELKLDFNRANSKGLISESYTVTKGLTTIASCEITSSQITISFSSENEYSRFFITTCLDKAGENAKVSPSETQMIIELDTGSSP